MDRTEYNVAVLGWQAGRVAGQTLYYSCINFASFKTHVYLDFTSAGWHAGAVPRANGPAQRMPIRAECFNEYVGR
jgi:hypothetical protein